MARHGATKGETVMTIDARAVQQRLKDAGWYHGTVDGDFGRRSWCALLSGVAKRELGDRGLVIGAACMVHSKGQSIDTPLRIAHWLAQTATETGAYRNLSENLNYTALRLTKVFPRIFKTEAEAEPFAGNPVKLANKVYANKNGNGGEASGDGWAYRGRGLIQLTGRGNYAAREADTKLPLVANPELASDPATSVEIACKYWTSRKINVPADADDVMAVRLKVNAKGEGIEDTKIYLKRAKGFLIIA